MLDRDDPHVAPVDEEAALERSGYRGRPLAWLLDAFERERAESMRLLRPLTAEHVARSGRHAQLGGITVADVIHHVAFHDLVHVRQIASMLEGPMNDARANMRDAF